LTVPDSETAPPSPDEYVAQGDVRFAKMHLYGWRQAESLYNRAFEIQEHGETLDKLLLTRFLLLIRETDEGIFGDHSIENLDFICAGSDSHFRSTLCEMGRTRLRFAGVLDEVPPIALSPGISWELLNGKRGNSALEAYLYLLFVRDMVRHRYAEELELFLEEYPDSPFAAYLLLVHGNLGGRPDAVVDPEFAEFHVYSGEELISRESYQDGIASLTEALDLVPDYTRASIALGNLFLFTLQCPEGAQHHYETTLKSDPRSVAANYGLAVSYHYLGRYLESQVLLDRLLTEDYARWSTVESEYRPYYRGQACYYKAYNYYLTNMKVEAREWVERARVHQPDAEGPNYLSGVLNFEKELIPEAEQDFFKVIDQGTDLCDAYFRLGKIEHWRESDSAIPHFKNSGICLERNLEVILSRLEQVRKMGLGPVVMEQVEATFKSTIEKRRRSSIASIISMIEIAESMEHSDIPAFLRTMEARLDRLSRGIKGTLGSPRSQ
jgi:tetratricopeptide (TPR) repeat protein